MKAFLVMRVKAFMGSFSTSSSLLALFLPVFDALLGGGLLDLLVE